MKAEKTKGIKAKNVTANHGITLIALVITLIVLLILAEIAISTISGDNSILIQAGNAKEKTVKGTEKEQLALALMNAKSEAALENRTELSKEDVIENLKNTFGEDNVKENENFIGIGPWTYIGENERYKIDKAGNITTKSADEDIKFYIYHSSDNTVETATVKQGETFDIYSKTKPNFLYGGYFSNYAGKGSYAGDGIEISQGTDAEYVSSYETWKKDEAYTEKGTEMHPQDEETYYIKEMDSEKYLRNYVHYSASGGKILTLWYYSSIDDNLYKRKGAYINDEQVRYRKPFTTVTMTVGSRKRVLVASEIFHSNYGYLIGGKITDYMTENAIISIIPYWVTRDEIEVKGKYTGIMNCGNCNVSGEGSLTFNPSVVRN